MARPIWTGVISFGLVSVPVAMYPATREHEVSFHQFERGTSDRIRYQRINERTGKEVDYADIVKGAEVGGGGEYVMVEPDELDEIAPGRSKSIEIHRFVDLDTIDPLYYQKTYYMGPGDDQATKAYTLLREAMAESNKAAIGTLVMRSKEYLATIRPDGPLLVLETMFFADEVRDPKEVLDGVPGRAKAKPEEKKMAMQLIDSMTGDWNPKDYRDTYTDRVKKLIKAKHAGREVTAAAPAPEPTVSTELMEVLRRSIEATRAGRAKPKARNKTTQPAAEKTATKNTTTKKTAAKKTATKKPATKKPATKKATAKKTATKKATAKTTARAKR